MVSSSSASCMVARLNLRQTGHIPTRGSPRNFQEPQAPHWVCMWELKPRGSTRGGALLGHAAATGLVEERRMSSAPSLSGSRRGTPPEPRRRCPTTPGQAPGKPAGDAPMAPTARSGKAPAA
eukprot:9498996-Pyramimonas_sp.AAC.1